MLAHSDAEVHHLKIWTSRGLRAATQLRPSAMLLHQQISSHPMVTLPAGHIRTARGGAGRESHRAACTPDLRGGGAGGGSSPVASNA